MRAGHAAGARDGFRRASLGISVALMVQSGVGAAVFLQKHAAHDGAGLFSALGHALGSGPVVLAVHAWIGLVVVGGSVHTLMSARATGRPLLLLTSGVGALCLLGAALSGAAYVDGGRGAASVAMAVLTGIALVCYLANVVMSDREGSTRA